MKKSSAVSEDKCKGEAKLGLILKSQIESQPSASVDRVD